MSAPIGTGLWQAVDQPVGIEFLQPFGGECRAGAIPQQPLQSAPVIGRKKTGDRPRFSLVDQPAPRKCAQDAPADAFLYCLGIARIQLVRRAEAYPLVRIGLEYAVGDADVKVRMNV